MTRLTSIFMSVLSHHPLGCGGGCGCV